MRCRKSFLGCFFFLLVFSIHRAESQMIKNDAEIVEFHGWNSWEIARRLTQSFSGLRAELGLVAAFDSIRLFIKLCKILPDDNQHYSLALPCRHGNHPRRQNISTGARRWITEYFESAGETFAVRIEGESQSRLKQYFHSAQIELCGWLSGIWCLLTIFSEKRFGVRWINFWYLFCKIRHTSGLKIRQTSRWKIRQPLW